MSTEVKEQKQEVSLEVVKSKLQIALQKEGFLKLQENLNKLVISEDNIVEVQELFKKIRGLKSVITAKHAEIKKPYLTASQTIDQAKRDYEALLETIVAPHEKKFREVCLEIDRRRIEQEKEEQRKLQIQDGMEKNILAWSQKIAACITLAQLNSVESSINLHKGQPQLESKFWEFTEDYKKKLSGLTGLIKQQKDNIKELERLAEELKAAEEAQDELSMLDLQAAQDERRLSIEEIQIQVQEEAIATATEVKTEVATEILPSLSARRSIWKFEVTDIKLLQKKMPHLVMLVADEEKIKELMKAKKADGSFDNKEALEYFGIKFFKEKLF